MKCLLTRCLISSYDLSAEQAALVIALGCVIGVFPIMGCPTAMCLIVAGLLRINPAPLLAINHICSPLQLVLILPLARAGAWIGGNGLSASHPAIRIGETILYALLGWTLLIPVGIGLYFVLLLALRNHRPAWLSRLECNIDELVSFWLPLGSRHRRSPSGGQQR